MIYKMSKWPELYVDYVNNFMTLERWAEYYDMEPEHAREIYRMGRLTDNFSEDVSLNALLNGFASVEDIKEAVDAGKIVYHNSNGYEVVKDNLGQYLIVCRMNDYTIGLTSKDGRKLNGKLEEFYEGNV